MNNLDKYKCSSYFLTIPKYNFSTVANNSNGDYFMNKYIQNLAAFVIGGLSYPLLELIWRGHTHWSMMLAGGVCMVLMFEIYNTYDNMNFLSRALVGSFVITSVELAFGLVLNYRLKMDIWDYSDKRFNFMGQICLLYTFLWGLLSIPVSVLCIRLKGLFERINLNGESETA